MRVAYMDYETFWSNEHSLSKMNPIEYVMHPETEIQVLSIAFDNYPIDVLFGEERIRAALAKLDWSDTLVVAHNGSGFDHLISAWRFGIRPKAWGCTLAMSKPFLGLTVGGSLKKVSEHLGLPPKGSLDEVNTKGKKFAQFTVDEIAKMKTYCGHDTFLCREIFKHYAPQIGKKELKLIDMSIRMTTEPEFEADTTLLEQALATEIQRKNMSLRKLAGMCGVETADEMKDIVMSQPQFAGLLAKIGAEVPMKESPTAKDEHGQPKMIPALAKSDQGMTDLLEYEDPDGDEERAELVRVAACTRLEVKSTQLETRLQTFLKVAKYLGGVIPMPVNYCGAVTTWRFSGSMKMNVQNMPRVDPSNPKPSDALRQSVRAPKGMVIIPVDSSNIELRVAHALAGQMDTVTKLRNKEDLYCWFASTLFGRTITKADKLERFIGKVAMLSLQYGASWKAFQNMVRVQSKGATTVSDDEAKRIVKVWRSMFPAIAGKQGIWAQCDKAITSMFTGNHMVIDAVGLCHTTHERIITPDGHWLSYPKLRKNMNMSGHDEWKYGEGRSSSRIYGAMLFENLCQHIARLIVGEQTLELHKRYPAKLTCHDEGVVLAWEDEAEECKAYAEQCFSKAPAWWPDIPLACEAGVGETYAAAK